MTELLDSWISCSKNSTTPWILDSYIDNTVTKSHETIDVCFQNGAKQCYDST